MFWAEIWKNIGVFVSENFQFLEVKFSIYLNRRVFVMKASCSVFTLLLQVCLSAYLILTCYLSFVNKSFIAAAFFIGNVLTTFQLRNRSALAVICWVINHCLEVSCKVDQITSAEREWFIFLQLTDKLWFITQQITHKSWSISILTHRKRRKCNCIL